MVGESDVIDTRPNIKCGLWTCVLILAFLVNPFMRNAWCQVAHPTYKITFLDSNNAPIEGVSVWGNKGLADSSIPRTSNSDGVFSFSPTDIDDPATENNDYDVAFSKELDTGGGYIFDRPELKLRHCGKAECAYTIKGTRSSTRINAVIGVYVTNDAETQSLFPVGAPSLETCPNEPKYTDKNGYVVFSYVRHVASDGSAIPCNDKDSDPENDHIPIIPLDPAGFACDFQSPILACGDVGSVQTHTIQASCREAEKTPVSSTAVNYTFNIRKLDGTLLDHPAMHISDGLTATHLSSGTYEVNAPRTDKTFNVIPVKANDGGYYFYPSELFVRPDSCPNNQCDIWAIQQNGKIGAIMHWYAKASSYKAYPGIEVSVSNLPLCPRVKKRITDRNGGVQFPTRFRPVACSDDDSNPDNNFMQIHPSANGCTFQHNNTHPFKACQNSSHQISGAFTANCELNGDFDGDGQTDSASRDVTNNSWSVATSSGVSFSGGAWDSNTIWVDLRVADFDKNGYDDILGRSLDTGKWLLSMSDGRRLVHHHWGGWTAKLSWHDVLIGNFDNDPAGLPDIAARVAESGDWWIAENKYHAGCSQTKTCTVNKYWNTWSSLVQWTDVSTGDFNGDGLPDIVGRIADWGYWWVALNNGDRFRNESWGRWSEKVTWMDVRVGEFTGDDYDDIIGRAAELSNNNAWWMAVSNGSRFLNSHVSSTTNSRYLAVAQYRTPGDQNSELTGLSIMRQGPSGGYETTLLDLTKDEYRWINLFPFATPSIDFQLKAIDLTDRTVTLTSRFKNYTYDLETGNLLEAWRGDMGHGYMHHAAFEYNSSTRELSGATSEYLSKFDERLSYSFHEYNAHRQLERKTSGYCIKDSYVNMGKTFLTFHQHNLHPTEADRIAHWYYQPANIRDQYQQFERTIDIPMPWFGTFEEITSYFKTILPLLSPYPSSIRVTDYNTLAEPRVKVHYSEKRYYEDPNTLKSNQETVYSGEDSYSTQLTMYREDGTKSAFENSHKSVNGYEYEEIYSYDQEEKLTEHYLRTRQNGEPLWNYSPVSLSISEVTAPSGNRMRVEVTVRGTIRISNLDNEEATPIEAPVDIPSSWLAPFASKEAMSSAFSVSTDQNDNRYLRVVYTDSNSGETAVFKISLDDGTIAE